METKILVNATKEDIDKARIEILSKENSSLQRAVNSLSRQVTNLILEVTSLRGAIEHARQSSSKLGAELALRELVIDVREGNISSKYRDEKTIKMLEEKFNGS